MRHIFSILAVLAAGPVWADVDAVIDDHILPGYAAFDQATATLRDEAGRDCDKNTLRPAWNGAFDAWMGVSHLRFGPVEQNGRANIIAFWPDERGATPKALAALIADQDPIIDTPTGMAQVSVAARGLYPLEYLLYDEQFAEMTPYDCALIRAISGDLADIAQQINAEWRDAYGATLSHAGEPGNTTYLSDREAKQVLFTALITGLEFTADQRLGRPLGSFDRPRPTRAENHRSARSQRNVILSLGALADLARTLGPDDMALTDAAFTRAISLAETLDDADFSGVSDPSERLKIEILQQAIHATRDAVLAEIGPSLGVSAGFNAADGD